MTKPDRWISRSNKPILVYGPHGGPYTDADGREWAECTVTAENVADDDRCDNCIRPLEEGHVSFFCVQDCEVRCTECAGYAPNAESRTSGWMEV